MLKKRILLLSGLLLITLALALYAAVKQTQKLYRDPVVLMNKYYRFKNTNPQAAERALLIILNQNPSYLPALKEYSQWLLGNKEPLRALPSLEHLHELMPENHSYTFQLAYLYYLQGNWEKSKVLLVELSQQVTGHLSDSVQEAFKAMASYLPYYQYHAAVNRLTEKVNEAAHQLPMKESQLAYVAENERNKDHGINDWFNGYYAVKSKDPITAQRLIKKVINKHPNNLQALKEAGFLAIAQGHRIQAIDYFTRVYNLNHDPNIAMQLAYLYEQMNNRMVAYHYFKLATHSSDKRLSLVAENALTTLVGQQTKFLPSPYFAEIYFNPFYQSRFNLTVLPFYGRAGIEQQNSFRTKEYMFLRRTSDNRSANLGELSQLYEDDVEIIGVGAQITPFQRVPLVGYVETGAAYDLVYRQRNRWRADLRTGLMYYRDFGTPPGYFETLKVSHNYYSDWYGEVTYFTRYNNNVIGVIRTHQGIRFLQYKSSMVNLYITARVIEDTQRQFFNNIAEVGPGISFVPSNRYNIQLRYEHIKGVYLPAGASINPYGKYYQSDVVQLLFYMKF